MRTAIARPDLDLPNGGQQLFRSGPAAAAIPMRGVLARVAGRTLSRAWSVAEVGGLAPEAYVAGLMPYADPARKGIVGRSMWPIPGMPVSTCLFRAQGPRRHFSSILLSALVFVEIDIRKEARTAARVGGESFYGRVARPGSGCSPGDRREGSWSFCKGRSRRKRYPDGELLQLKLQDMCSVEGYDGNRVETRSTFININGVLTEVGTVLAGGSNG